MARAMLAPVIGSPASSSQNMIWRYSSSATVASAIQTILVSGATSTQVRCSTPRCGSEVLALWVRLQT